MSTLVLVNGSGPRLRPGGPIDLPNESASETLAAAAQQAYSNLPLSFEPNVGQMPASTDYQARGAGHGISLNARGAVLSVTDGQAGGRTAVLGMRLLGSQLMASNSAIDPLPGKVNYYLGADATKHHAGISTYQRVSYRGVYPGIDVVYYGNHRQLEYDFVVSPGGDSNDIVLTFDGASDIVLDDSGDLVLSSSSGDARISKPVVYQMTDAGRRSVEGAFTLTGDEVRFTIGAYDRSRTLVIDPTLAFSTLIGGSSVNFSEASHALGVAVDSAGNPHITGFTCAFPTTPGTPQQEFGGGSCPPNGGDAFAAKLSADGRSLLYATYLGGPDNDVGTGIALDSLGQAYIKGTAGVGLPTTTGSYQRTLPNPERNSDFVTRLTTAGQLSYSTYVGEAQSDGNADLGGVAVDGSGNAYITGAVVQGVQVAYIAKLNSTGSGLLYLTHLAGGEDTKGLSIAIDTAGRAYVYGLTSGEALPTTAGSVQPSYGGGLSDGFVAELSADGSTFLYVTYLGGRGLESPVGRVGKAIALGPNNRVYVVGSTQSFNFPVTPGAYQPGHDLKAFDKDDATLTVMALAGNGPSDILYSTFLGDAGDDNANAVAVDSSGHAFITGITFTFRFDSQVVNDFPLVNPLACCSAWPVGDGHAEAFVAAIDPAGAGASDLLFSSFLGGSAQFIRNLGTDIALGSGGGVFVVGQTYSESFPTTPGAFQTVKLGLADAFVTKIILPLTQCGAVEQVLSATTDPQTRQVLQARLAGLGCTATSTTTVSPTSTSTTATTTVPTSSSTSTSTTATSSTSSTVLTTTTTRPPSSDACALLAQQLSLTTDPAVRLQLQTIQRALGCASSP